MEDWQKDILEKVNFEKGDILSFHVSEAGISFLVYISRINAMGNPEELFLGDSKMLVKCFGSHERATRCATDCITEVRKHIKLKLREKRLDNLLYEVV